MCLVFSSPALGAVLQDPITKGRHWVGITLGALSSHHENTTESLQQVVVDDESSWQVDLSYGRFVHDGTSLGAAFRYGHDAADLTTDQTVGPDLRTENSRSVAGAAIQSRSYLTLGNPHFYLYNQTGLSAGFSWGSSKTTGASTTEGDLSGQRYAIDLQPGIAVLVDRGFAVEASVQVLGISYQTERVKVSGQPDAVKTETRLDFEIDLLKLGIGLTYYF